MDLGLTGRKAIVCASSQGLGLACARIAGARRRDRLHQRPGSAEAARRSRPIWRTGPARTVVAVCADINDRRGSAARCSRPAPSPTSWSTTTPARRPASWRTGRRRSGKRRWQANMMSPIFLMQAVVPGMRKRRFGRIVSITSAMVKTPRPHMALSTTARTGLTAFAKALSLDVACDNVTINQLLPERIDSPRQVAMTQRMMNAEKLSWDQARARITAAWRPGVSARCRSSAMPAPTCAACRRLHLGPEPAARRGLVPRACYDERVKILAGASHAATPQCASDP